jgi:hypothetical protein
MKIFKEYDSVIYTDETGNSIDTFVVYDTDAETGLTHVNYMNLLVPLGQLQLHPKTLETNYLPVHDIFSFEILKKLKSKYTDNLADLKAKTITRPDMKVYAYSQAS